MTRLAIVGIDGATFDILRPLIEGGECPHIARILREGVSGDLESEKPPITPPAWTSMMTGVNPGRHGVYHFIRRLPNSYGYALNDSRKYSGKDIMTILGKRGWSVGTFSVPMVFPPFPVNQGYQVAGIPCPIQGDSLGWPAGLMKELESWQGHPYEADVDYGPFDGDNEKPHDNLEQYARLRDELFRIERDRLALMRRLLKDKPTDFFFTVISVTDRCQHYFWKFQDKSHPGWSEKGAKLFGEVIRDSYRLADEFVGAVREIVGDDVPIALVSDHGFRPQYSDFHLNKWLEQEGYLVRKPVPRWTLGVATLGEVMHAVKVPWAVKLLGPIAKWKLFRPKRKVAADMRDIDWPKTRAYTSLHGIALNMKGREPIGIVDQRDFHSLLQEIEAKLTQVKMPDGSPAFDYGAIKDDIYEGPMIDEAPDYQFQMAGLSCLNKDDLGSHEMFTMRKNAAISGQHRFNGIFAFAASNVREGLVLDGLHIQDTVPTLLHALGEAVPAWMDGSVNIELLQKQLEIQFDRTAEPEPGNLDESAFSTAESDAIEESLRGLGYL